MSADALRGRGRGRGRTGGERRNMSGGRRRSHGREKGSEVEAKAAMEGEDEWLLALVKPSAANA